MLAMKLSKKDEGLGKQKMMQKMMQKRKKKKKQV
jgi:hypothetical protein